MALSNGRGFTSNGPLIFLSPRSKDKEGHEIERPYFEVSRVNPETNKIEQTDEKFSEINSVSLFSIQFKEREARGGGINKHVVLYLRDKESNETYSLDLTYRIATRSLFNSLLSLKSNEGLSISIYRSKKGYESFYLTQNAVKVGWKFENREDLPEAEVIKDRKGTVIKTDYGAVDDFFEAELKALVAALGLGQKQATSSSTEQTAAEQGSGESEQSEPAPAPPPAPAPAKRATPAPAAKPATPATVAKSATTAAKPVAKPAARPVAKVAVPASAPQPPADAADSQDDSSIPF